MFALGFYTVRLEIITLSIDICGMSIVKNFASWLNINLLLLVNTISSKGMIGRMWFVTMIFIGFTEYFFVYLFVKPIAYGNMQKVILYLKVVLVIYSLGMIVINDCFLVVAFHTISNLVVIVIGLTLYARYREVCFLYMGGLICINILAGILQQLMKANIVPVGPLNHNDWYHMLIIAFIVLLYILLTKGKLIERLNYLGSNQADKKDSEQHQLI